MPPVPAQVHRQPVARLRREIIVSILAVGRSNASPPPLAGEGWEGANSTARTCGTGRARPPPPPPPARGRGKRHDEAALEPELPPPNRGCACSRVPHPSAVGYFCSRESGHA